MAVAGGRAGSGEAAEPFEMRVELGKVREFARATNSRHHEYQQDEGVSPVTFLQTSAFWQTRANDPLPDRNMRRSLHAEQEFVFHGPPPGAGTRLIGAARIDKVYEKQSRRGTLTFVELVTEYRDEAGALVAESRLTGVEMPETPGE